LFLMAASHCSIVRYSQFRTPVVFDTSQNASFMGVMARAPSDAPRMSAIGNMDVEIIRCIFITSQYSSFVNACSPQEQLQAPFVSMGRRSRSMPERRLRRLDLVASCKPCHCPRLDTKQHVGRDMVSSQVRNR